MTHQSNHRGLRVQKAGQASWDGTSNQPLPSNTSAGVERVAGGNALSKMTSTAALESFRFSPFPNQRRAPRQPESSSAHLRSKSQLRMSEIEPCPRHSSFPSGSVDRKEGIMIPGTIQRRTSFKPILPVLLRITSSLLLWTLGASAMDIRVSHIQPKQYRVIINFPVDRTKIEALQRWVNGGHDSWCRDPQMVAASSLRRVSPDLADSELASFPLESEQFENTKAVYTFHALDGQTTYRITLRRHLYLLRSAGSLNRIIWIPESAEIITRDMKD
jgi:hypothetical protein